LFCDSDALPFRRFEATGFYTLGVMRGLQQYVQIKMRWLHSRSQRKEACRESNQDQFDSGGMT
jgi:hypothetical protein